jgi:hypothetical protein
MDNAYRHGTWWNRWQGVRGAELARAMEGRFGRMFSPNQVPPANFGEDDLKKLADAMTADFEMPPTAEGTVDAEENQGIVAAYTYFGQFIDHDITFDPTSHLRQFAHDLNKLIDFRTPRLDLDCLYGRGPSEQPYLYASDGIGLLLGNPLTGNGHDPAAQDLQRGPNGRALIGDPRNDENRIVAQLHATMIRLHNRMASLMPGASFDDVRNQVRWHYQWVVVNDFLPTVINDATLKKVFPHLASGKSVGVDRPVVSIPFLQNQRTEFLMPVEFSVAAYRFGHSMIRPIYRLNETIQRRPIFSVLPDASADLGGMRPIPNDWAIDWQFFIDIGDGDAATSDEQNPDDPIAGGRVPQKSYKIDTSLVNPLSALPPIIASNPPSLPFRNLLRGRDFELPSGQDVARALGADVIDDDDLIVGKATDEDPKQPMKAISGVFAGNAPLWAYILSEAQVTSWASAPGGPKDGVTTRLGSVGGQIVAEVVASMLLADKTSFLNMQADFSPRNDFVRNGKFGLSELIRAALGK